MSGRLKTNDDRRRRNAPTFDWTWLPYEGRSGRAPKMPELPAPWKRGRSSAWSASARSYWRWLWSTPQATQWDQTGLTLHTAVILKEAIERDPLHASKHSAELRQVEDRHGLNPKALLQLRWKIKPAPNDVQKAIVERTGGDGSVTPIGDRSVTMPKGNAGASAWREWAVACGAMPEEVADLGRDALREAFGKAPAPASARSSAVDRLR